MDDFLNSLLIEHPAGGSSGNNRIDDGPDGVDWDAVSRRVNLGRRVPLQLSTIKNMAASGMISTTIEGAYNFERSPQDDKFFSDQALKDYIVREKSKDYRPSGSITTKPGGFQYEQLWHVNERSLEAMELKNAAREAAKERESIPNSEFTLPNQNGK